MTRNLNQRDGLKIMSSNKEIAIVSLGSLVYVRYQDHVLFKDCDSSKYFPWIRETIGWLDYDDEKSIRIVWERYAESFDNETVRMKSTGISLVKNAVMEIRKVA